MDTESRWHRIWLRIKDLYYTGPPAIPPDEVGVAYDESPTIKELKAMFEGKEAIFVAKGAIRVRVSKIRGSTERSVVWADIDEIQTPGLGVGGLAENWQKGHRSEHCIFSAGPQAACSLGGFNESWRKRQSSAHWIISGVALTGYSENKWVMGYGGWQLYFYPPAIQHVLELAADFPESMDTWDRYNAIVSYIPFASLSPNTQFRHVFPDHPLNKARLERYRQ